jgi:serine/threonine protein phosphatase PrpC
MLRAAETIWKTDTGRQRRNNEDNAFARPPVFVVADGMGGAQAGEVASRLAIEAFQRQLPESGTPEQRLADCVRAANRTIYETSRTEHERAGMGTTLTAAYLDDADLAIAHVGDSRAYLFRGHTLKRLTQDHSLVEELKRRGKLTEEQAAEHPQRSIITRALGPEPDVEVDTWTYPVRAGDVLLLCSDGLTSMINEQQIASILASAPSLERTAQLLIAAANEAGGRDNITVILFRLEEVAGGAPSDQAAGGAPSDQPTVVGIESPYLSEEDSPAARHGSPGARSGTALAPEARASTPAAAASPRGTPAGAAPPVAAPSRRSRARLARRQVRPGPGARATSARRRRWVKPAVALLATVIVLFLVGAGGYLATRQLYFVGTNQQGIVTVFRGLPYNLIGGIRLYETYYVSGVPASVLPADRRSELLNHQLRSQSDASNLVREIELGQIVK